MFTQEIAEYNTFFLSLQRNKKKKKPPNYT